MSSGDQPGDLETGAGASEDTGGGARPDGERMAKVGAIELCYETFGEETAPPLLLVMGLASQMVVWDDEFCRTLADRGFYVVRFDNRDVGRSTIFREARAPTVLQLFRRDPRGAAYKLDDMADDAAGLLDELGIPAAHVVGASMGGMIAQLIAIRHPERVLSLVSIMSTTGHRRVGKPDPRLLPLLIRKTPRDREAYVRSFAGVQASIGSKVHPATAERIRALAERCYERGIHPAGTARQLAAIQTTADRTPKLRELSVPTTVIHGEDDRLVTPSGGRATAKAIPDARLVMIPGMAHDLPLEVWPQVLDEIEATAARAATPADHR